MIDIGFLHKGDLFIFESTTYKVLYANGNNGVICKNLKTEKKTIFAIDAKVERMKGGAE